MLIQFDQGSASRIGRVVRLVEQQVPKTRPLVFDALLGTPRQNAAVFRIATFTGAWSKDTVKTVTLSAQTAATASALNLFANIPAPTGSASCAIARDGTAWYLIAAEC
jgi:hypothetical protein